MVNGQSNEKKAFFLCSFLFRFLLAGCLAPESTSATCLGKITDESCCFIARTYSTPSSFVSFLLQRHTHTTSKSKTMSSKWVFPWENIESTDITLEQRRKLAKFIIDLGTKIPVYVITKTFIIQNITLLPCLFSKSNLCLYTAVAYMQRFYMLQSAKQFYPIVCFLQQIKFRLILISAFFCSVYAKQLYFLHVKLKKVR